MKYDLQLVRKILSSMQNGAVFDRLDFSSFLDQNDQPTPPLKKYNDLVEYDDEIIEFHLDLMYQLEIISYHRISGYRILSFGIRYLSLLENHSLLEKLKIILNSSFNLYTPQTLVSLAQHIDLKDKGFTITQDLTSPINASEIILPLQELITQAKDVTKKLDSLLFRSESTMDTYEEAKKILEPLIKRAEAVLYP